MGRAWKVTPLLTPLQTPLLTTIGPNVRALLASALTVTTVRVTFITVVAGTILVAL